MVLLYNATVLIIILFSIFFELSCLHKNESNTKSPEDGIGQGVKKLPLEHKSEYAFNIKYEEGRNDTYRRFRMNKRGKPETYYEPYMHQGEWVFLRTTPAEKPKKKRQKFPAKAESSTTPKSEPQRDTSQIKLAQIYRDCNIDCPPIYEENYEDVCGQRFHTYNGKWTNEYKNFSNLCQLEKENCKDADKRPMWFLLHRGKCPDPELKKLPIKVEDIIKKKRELMEKIDKGEG